MVPAPVAVYTEFALQNKQKQQLARVPLGHCRYRRIGLHDSNRSQTIRRRRDAGVPRFKSAKSPGLPTRFARAMERKTLAAEEPFGRNIARGKPHLVIGLSFILRRTSDLNDLKAGGGFQHTMANLRRLQNAITNLEREGRSLVFVNHSRPARFTVNHLEERFVVMNVILRLAAVEDANVRGYETPAEPSRNQIAVLHARPPHIPRVVRRILTADHEFPIRRINRNVRHKI